MGQAQKYGKNRPRFEYRKIHFGVHLGATTSNFHYRLKQGFDNPDSIAKVSIRSAPGLAFQMPLISWNPKYTFNLRFHPSISFHEAYFDYAYRKNDILEQREYRWEATNLNFPIQFKLNTKRLHNFGAYALGGFQYSRNLVDQNKVQQTPNNPIVKTNPNDFAFNVGGGFDFFLPYFKFGLELKLVSGVRNVLVQDNTFFTNPLESLRTRSFWISFTFEG